jgi:hypothetical protein
MAIVMPSAFNVLEVSNGINQWKIAIIVSIVNPAAK